MKSAWIDWEDYYVNPGEKNTTLARSERSRVWSIGKLLETWRLTCALGMGEFVVRQEGAISWEDLWAKQDAWRERKLKLKEKEEKGEKESEAGSDTIMGEADTLGEYLPYRGPEVRESGEESDFVSEDDMETSV